MLYKFRNNKKFKTKYEVYAGLLYTEPYLKSSRSWAKHSNINIELFFYQRLRWWL